MVKAYFCGGLDKKTKAERRESNKKHRAKKYKIHSKQLGSIYAQQVRKRAV